ncbi:MAG: PEGA domain-containing protein [Methanoregula sp.]|uniref:PEGA domain-containing protein n=1 Tax=Methanoregula sp. TaxID=2052170 RepID=UPI003C73B62F
MPAYADNGGISITYRGAGGYYVGDSIAFDGKNTIGNTTVIRITGPGLPAAGVPPYNLTDIPGTGNTAVTDASGTWAFYWDTSRTIGIENLYTAQYTLTAYDLSHPEITTSVSIMLKKPEFYVTMSPNPARIDDYIQIAGDAENGASSLEINVLDSSGNKVHTFTSPVSAGGFFNYGFHVDMPPGQYTVTITSPSMLQSLTKTLTITATNTNATTVGNATAGQAVLPGTTVTGIPTQPAANPTNMQTTVSPVNGTLIVSSKPVGASVYLDSAMVGKTPLTLDSVSPGAHTVELKSPGYLSVSIDVVVSADKPTEISPEMVNAPSGIPLSPFVAIFGFIGAMALFATIRKRIP